MLLSALPLVRPLNSCEDAELALVAMLEDWSIDARPIVARSSAGDAWDKNSGASHFSVGILAPNGQRWSGEYSAGSAHPIAQAREALAAGGSVLRAWQKRAGMPLLGSLRKDLAELAGYNVRKTIYLAGVEDTLRRAYRPALVDVVGSLFADAGGFQDGLESFREWSDEYGAEWENPADALECYDACKLAARFLRRAFAEQFEAAGELAREL